MNIIMKRYDVVSYLNAKKIHIYTFYEEIFQYNKR